VSLRRHWNLTISRGRRRWRDAPQRHMIVYRGPSANFVRDEDVENSHKGRDELLRKGFHLGLYSMISF
jgi:hypothetical protein